MRSLRQMTSDLESWVAEKPETRTCRLRFANRLAGLGLPNSWLPDPKSVLELRLDDPDPIPARLGDWIEERTRHVHSPWRKPSKVGTTYMLPNWLPRIQSWGFKPPSSIRAWMRHGLPSTTRVTYPSSFRRVDQLCLKDIVLRRQSVSAQRRESMLNHAEWILDSLRAVLGYDPVRSTWLEQMIEDTVEFERWTLSSVWNPFVLEFNRPASLFLRKDCPNLRDQLKLERGCDGGAHRRSFAEQQPWAAISLLNRSSASRGLNEIDRNPANGLLAAARELCCFSGRAYCPRSVTFARFLPRRRHAPSFDHILDECNCFGRHSMRCLLMEAHVQDGGELISHIRDGPTVVLRQITRAHMLRDSPWNYRDVADETTFATAALLLRMMVRDRFVDPARLEPNLAFGAMVVMSAESLAAYANCDRYSLPEYETFGHTTIDRGLDAGIRAFVHLVGSTRKPRLTTRQLIRLSEHCEREGTILSRNRQLQDLTDWSIAPQLLETCERLGSEDLAMVPLAKIADLEDEGRTMKHCLAYSNSYVTRLLVGQISVISVRTATGVRATLVLQPVQATRYGEAVIQNWRIEEFRGSRNARPPRFFHRLVERLVEELDAQCPIPIPESVRRQRRRVVDALGSPLEINRDKGVADDRWRSFYRRALPPRFSKLTPHKIVASYYQSLEARR